ncbi:hypothetical protein B0J13DRAFT_166144 [Dactylonectria estremocensis]|uniref:Uncharacterized protein n=1 Tax=Dactylonectria estremocensis TaxID=1079267 RepID=A0A9P9DJP8_9HYPO|nr:hypothetical protein B0J13DRAFT_166144 [Dactylonectria estremocensis]
MQLLAKVKSIPRTTPLPVSSIVKGGRGKDACRFGMPRDLRPHSEVDELGVVHLARNHGWVNPWNPAIASCIRSNHDISWIPTTTKCLALIYYLTNYATKDDVSPHQMLVKAALLKQSMDKAKATQTPDAADMRFRKMDMDQFALRCFNTLSHDREISGVQIANSLLQLPTYYTRNYNFVQVNLWWLRRYVRTAIESTGSLFDGSPEFTGEEECAFQPKDTAPVSRFDNYRWRGPDLAHLTFFEYCMLVDVKSRSDATTSDVEFDTIHPKSNTHVQRMARTESQVKTVSFNGQFSQYQIQEEGVRGGHPNTTAIKNDLAEVQLGFFLPWDQLPALFQQHASEYDTKRDACSRIWDIVEPTLSPHNRNFARNMELLRKSREDAMVDAALRNATAISQDDLDHNIDDMEIANSDLDAEESQDSPRQEFTNEALISAYHSIATSWRKELHAASQRIPFLSSKAHLIQCLQSRSLVPLDIFRLPTFTTSGIRFFPNPTLESWKLQIKGLATRDELDNIEPEERITLDGDNFGPDLGDGTFHPTLSSLQAIPNLMNLRSQVSDSPSGTTLTTLICKVLPLNTKQRLVIERVLSAAIA